MNTTAQISDFLPVVTEVAIKRMKVWGVVSRFSVDVLYDNLTYQEAIEKAKSESSEPGQDAVVVLLIKEFNGKPI